MDASAIPLQKLSIVYPVISEHLMTFANYRVHKQSERTADQCKREPTIDQ